MPKMFLKFDLVEDKEVSEIYFGAYNMYQMLSELKSRIRDMDKHGSEHKSAEDAVAAIHELFYDLMNEYNVNLEF